MINYTPSSLDSNKTLLQEFHSIEKYLHDNPIYKVYAIDTAYVSGTSQYDVADIDGDASGLSQGDVIVFTNNYYAIVSAVGDEIVAIKNPSSFKGDKGDDGAQGEQGEQGADGKDALVYKSYMTASQTPIVNINANIDNDQFNRDPVVGDVFEAFFVNSTTGHTYFIIYQAVAIVSVSVTQFKVKYVIDITGKQGETGKIALVYDETISFTYSAEQQLITVNLPFANFNRAPELNEDFIAILKDSGVEYLANCEVQTISGSNVTSIVASNITKVSGENGQNGTDGTDGTNGIDALAYTEIFRRAAAPVVSDAITMTLSKFTRTPVVNEKIVFVYEDTANNLTYQAQANIDSVTVESGTVGVSLEYVYQLTGPQGQAGSAYIHNITLNASGSDLTARGTITFINQSSTAFSRSTFAAELYNKGLTSDTKMCIVSGKMYIPNGQIHAIMCGIYSADGSTLTIVYSNATVNSSATYTYTSTFYDNVISI